ncbi:hypothetical protein AAHA92_13364 [Salvia divinorum]|uniref:Uncharacterized protein n=1 Tax=Salvia divinorum TaxID=28513 RepID=A0ABD1H8V4_SALDI
MGLNSVTMALSDFYTRHGKYQTTVVLNKRDSKKDVVGAAAAVPLHQHSATTEKCKLYYSCHVCCTYIAVIIRHV